MRSLAVMFFFFVLVFGFGSVILSAEVPEGFNNTDSNFSLGQISNSTKGADISTQVDRDDDPLTLTPCTSAPNDCTLRSALNVANSDGKPTTITFAGDYLIQVTQPLPTLTEDNTTVKAGQGQEVHIDGRGTAGSVLRITGAYVHVEGLRIYGSGVGYPNVVIDDAAHNVGIAHNVIGDNDAPYGNCGSSDLSYGGIFIDGQENIGDETRAWIYGNLVECNKGDGIIVRSGSVIIGKDPLAISDSSQRNVIHANSGFGISLGDTTGNTICDNEIIANKHGGLYMSNFHNNNVMYNNIVESSIESNLG